MKIISHNTTYLHAVYVLTHKEKWIMSIELLSTNTVIVAHTITIIFDWSVEINTSRFRFSIIQTISHRHSILPFILIWFVQEKRESCIEENKTLEHIKSNGTRVHSKTVTEIAFANSNETNYFHVVQTHKHGVPWNTKIDWNWERERKTIK